MQVFQQWLTNFEHNQRACIESESGTERFILVKKLEHDGGLGNQLPCHVTGNIGLLRQKEANLIRKDALRHNKEISGSRTKRCKAVLCSCPKVVTIVVVSS